MTAIVATAIAILAYALGHAHGRLDARRGIVASAANAVRTAFRTAKPTPLGHDALEVADKPDDTRYHV